MSGSPAGTVLRLRKFSESRRLWRLLQVQYLRHFQSWHCHRRSVHKFQERLRSIPTFWTNMIFLLTLSGRTETTLSTNGRSRRFHFSGRNFSPGCCSLLLWRYYPDSALLDHCQRKSLRRYSGEAVFRLAWNISSRINHHRKSIFYIFCCRYVIMGTLME